MTRKYITEVSGNVKGGFSYPLSPLTLIVGKNASGKSRAVDAISLAMTGRAASAGIGKREVDLMALAPPGSGELRATCKYSDGTESTWSCKGTTAKASRPEWSGPAGALLVDEARALLQSDSKSLRTALLSRIGTDVTAARLREMFPAAMWDLWANGHAGDWTVDAVLDALESVSSRLSRVRSEIRTAEALIEKGECADLLSPEEESELDALTQAAAQRGISAEEIQRVRQYIDEQERAIALCKEEIARREVAVQSIVPANEKAIALFRETKGLLTTVKEFLAPGQMAKCPVCAKHASKEDFLARLSEVDATLEAMSNVADVGYAAKSALRGAQARLANLEEKLGTNQRLLSRATPAVPVDRERMLALQARVAAVHEYLAAKERLSALTAQEGDLDTLRRIAAEVCGTLLDGEVDAFAARVTAALPRGMRAEIVLRDGSRKICRVAVKTDGSLHSRDFRVLSGAERAVLVSAFASALLGGGSGVQLVVIDDVWFDFDTLKSLMESLRRSFDGERGPSQVVVNAVTWPKRAKLPEGWSVVSLDGEGAQ